MINLNEYDLHRNDIVRLSLSRSQLFRVNNPGVFVPFPCDGTSMYTASEPDIYSAPMTLEVHRMLGGQIFFGDDGDDEWAAVYRISEHTELIDDGKDLGIQQFADDTDTFGSIVILFDSQIMERRPYVHEFQHIYRALTFGQKDDGI